MIFRNTYTCLQIYKYYVNLLNHSFFHSYNGKYLALCDLVIMTLAKMDKRKKHHYKLNDFISFVYLPRSNITRSCVNFIRNIHFALIITLLIHIHSNYIQPCLFLLDLVNTYVFVEDHTHRYAIIIHENFCLYFSDDYWDWVLFQTPTGCFYFFLRKQ